MRSRSQQSAFANPVLIGAVTVLIVLIAVFLAYNANTGLPFVPTRELKVDIANGSNLVIGNEVRSGGFRIGVISNMKPIALPSGQTGAQPAQSGDAGPAPAAAQRFLREYRQQCRVEDPQPPIGE